MYSLLFLEMYGQGCATFGIVKLALQITCVEKMMHSVDNQYHPSFRSFDRDRSARPCSSIPV
jgi:hypothetical protein